MILCNGLCNQHSFLKIILHTKLLYLATYTITTIGGTNGNKSPQFVYTINPLFHHHHHPLTSLHTYYYYLCGLESITFTKIHSCRNTTEQRVLFPFFFFCLRNQKHLQKYFITILQRTYAHHFFLLLL